MLCDIITALLVSSVPIIMSCHVIIRNRLSLSMGLRVLLLEPIPALSQGEASPGAWRLARPAHGRALNDEQCGVQHLTQGHLNMQLSLARSRDQNQRPSDH